MDDIAAGPPPTNIPVGNNSFSAPSTSSLLSSSGPPSGSFDPPSMADDPLAALMAPPPRSTYAPLASSSDHDDPLSALMAPPTVRMPPRGGNYGIADSSQGPPPSSSAPMFNIWVPPTPAPSSIPTMDSVGGENGMKYNVWAPSSIPTDLNGVTSVDSTSSPIAPDS